MLIYSLSVPRVAPVSVVLTSLDSTTIQICWEKIPYFPTLEEYEVRHQPFGQTNTSVVVTTTDGNSTSATISALNSSLVYTVIVAGKTLDGIGPFSSPVNLQPTKYTCKYNISLYTPNSKKVALGIGNWALEAIVWRSLKQIIYCFRQCLNNSFPMPNCQCPKQPFLN